MSCNREMDWNRFAFFLYIWGIANTVNGVIVISHDYYWGSGDSFFWIVNGATRLFIGFWTIVFSEWVRRRYGKPPKKEYHPYIK